MGTMTVAAETGIHRSTVDASTTDAGVRLRSLVVDHFAFVWRALVRLGVPRRDADDATQQVFLVVQRRLGDIAAGHERAFLQGTAVRIAARFRRTQHRRREAAEEPPLDRPDPTPGPDEALDRSRARALLDEVLDNMAEDVREVFVLFELEQMTQSEIAVLLGLPQGTVASRLRRGREEFHDHVARIQARMASEEVGS